MPTFPISSRSFSSGISGSGSLTVSAASLGLWAWLPGIPSTVAVSFNYSGSYNGSFSVNAAGVVSGSVTVSVTYNATSAFGSESGSFSGTTSLSGTFPNFSFTLGTPAGTASYSGAFNDDATQMTGTTSVGTPDIGDQTFDVPNVTLAVDIPAPITDSPDPITDAPGFVFDPTNALKIISPEFVFDFLSGNVLEGAVQQSTQEFLDDLAERMNAAVDAAGQAFLDAMGVARDFQQSLARVFLVRSTLENITQNAMQTGFDIMQGIVTGNMTPEEADARIDQLFNSSQSELKSALENINDPDFSVTQAFGGFQFIVDFSGSGNQGATARFSVEHGGQTLTGNDSTQLVFGGLLNDLINAGGGDDVVAGGYGDDEINTGAGNDIANGGPGNDRIDGGLGSDRMSGGDGDDTYVVDNAGDLVLELIGFGTDTIESSISFTLADNVENITLTGSAAIIAVGNDLDNSLTGNSGNNTLTGNAGDDILEGGAGADILDGGSGNNTGSYAYSAAAVSVDLMTGIGQFGDAQGDTLINIVNLIGSPGGDSLLGTGITNTIDGGAGNDLLRGRGGDDTLDGGDGLDVAQYAASRSMVTVTNNGDGSYTVNAVSSGEGTDQLVDVERLQVSDGVIALDISGNAGQTYRLYQASFARTPDTPGLSHNVNVMDSGVSLYGLSAAFLVSAEFVALYGANPSNATFIDALYQNVLGRGAEEAGFSGWNDRLISGEWDRADVLIGFSESPENIALVGSAIENGIWLG